MKDRLNMSSECRMQKKMTKHRHSALYTTCPAKDKLYTNILNF